MPDKMMPDHWGYVLAAYGFAAIAFGGYWRHLARRSRDLLSRRRGKEGGAA